MAVLTLQRSGSWSDTTAGTMPWTALTGSGTGGVAGDGDVVYNSNASYTLTIDGTQTVGRSAPTITGVAAPTTGANTGTTTTSLPTGTYYCRIVPVAAGVEGTASPDSSSMAITNGTSKPLVTLPALPAGATSWSIYLTAAGASQNGFTHRRYATGKSGSTTFELVSASYEDASVAFGSAQAISPASGIFSVGPLVLATSASLTCKGDILHTHSSGFTINPSSTLTMTVGSGITYFLQPGVINGQVSPLIVSGTSGNRATITKSGAGIARIGGYGTSNGFSGNASIQGQHFNLSGFGSSSVNALNTRWTSSETNSIANATADGCGTISFANMQPSASITLNAFEITNTLATTNALSLDCGSSYSAGTRSVTNCVIDKTTIFTGGGADTFTLTDNYFCNGMAFSSPTAARGWSSFTRNFWRRTNSGSVQAVPYDVSKCIIFADGSDVVNPHLIDPCTLSRAVVYSENVFDSHACDNDGDCILPTTAAVAGSYSLTLTNNLFLPNVNGDNIGTPLTCYGNNNLSVVFNHNTYVMGNQGLSFGEVGYAGYAGMWTSVRSNIAWQPTAGSRGWVAWDGLALAWDAAAGSVTNVDYNGKWNYSTSSPIAGQDPEALARGYLCGDSGGANYAFAAATVPGDHDVDGNPQFVDYTRSLAVFDQGYLGYPQASLTWTDATAYAVGDIVKAQTSGVYFGQVVNYRCITAHTSSNGSTTLGKPGLGSTGALKSWSTYWEVASLYYIRQSLLAGTTYTDSGLGVSNKSIVEVARAWIRAGFAPTNTAYKNAGHDSVDIGAVAGYWSSGGLFQSGGGFSCLNFIEC